MKIISRKEAKALGLKYYFTGKPCKLDHINKRLTSNGVCVDCKSIRVRAYLDKKSKEYKKKRAIEESLIDGFISKKDAISKGLNKYFTGKKCKNGHLSERYTSNSWCVKCLKEKECTNEEKEKKRERSRKYREENRDKILKMRRDYYESNKVEIRAKERERYCPEKTKAYRERPDRKIESKKYYDKYYKENKQKYRDYRNRPEVAVAIFTRRSLERIQSNWKGCRPKYEEILGYTFDKLKERIEFQFKDGMSWDNRSEWHIDHKKPVSRFIEQGVTDPKIVNSLSNLQPLWANDNRSKGAKFKQ